ncbi:MAG: SDR family oxidoreductase [Sphingomonadales bacterium]|nr:SDR family oxidoreductase [Sphingomonadales bacterium]
MLGDLNGKTAVVLGASAEGGTGFAIARALARAGAKVTIAARSANKLEALAAGIGARWRACDAGDAQQIAEMVRFAAGDSGLDIAVNAAALPVIGSIADLDFAEVEQATRVNYYGMLHFMRETAARMNDNGSIVLISSYSAVQPIHPHFAYACAKAATDCLVRYAALEYGPRGIRVNSVQPGPIKSDLARDLFAIPGVEDIFAREVPLGRIGLPDDYANAVLWLASGAFVTGLNLPVNGGNQLTRMPRADELPMGESSYEGDYD